MAVTLSIPLTDAEQAKTTEWLDVLLPGRTNAQKKKALEDHAKQLLRDDLARRVAGTRRQARLDAEAAQNAADAAAASVIIVVDPFNPAT